MARVTVEDCVLKVPNRFELVVYAAQRTRQISAGSSLTVDRDNDKNPVVALREIAEGGVEVSALRKAVVENFRHHIENDLHDDELAEIFAQETLSDHSYVSDEFKNLIEDENSSEEDTAQDQEDSEEEPDQEFSKKETL